MQLNLHRMSWGVAAVLKVEGKTGENLKIVL
jgi:hypothetical protein